MSEWYKNWFASEEYLEVYMHRDEQDANDLLNLILSETQIPAGAKVLDAACGAGRHSVILKEKGYNITAFDLSKVLLKIGKRNSLKLNYNINFFCADIRNVPLNAKFDLIINLFTSFGYFDSYEENFHFIKNSKNLIRKNGFFVLDYFNKYELLNNLVPETIKEKNGKIYFEKRFVSKNRIIKEISIKGNGGNNTYVESVGLYSPDEIISSFENLGFVIKNIYGDYKGNNFNKENSERLIIIAQKIN